MKVSVLVWHTYFRPSHRLIVTCALYDKRQIPYRGERLQAEYSYIQIN